MKELVIGIGEALFDMLPEGKKLGGAPANFAYHVSQFGINSCAVSAIGKDEQGRELTNELDSHNLKYQMDEVDYPTGEVQVSLDINGIPCYDIKKMWHGTISLLLRCWKTWQDIVVLFALARWHSAARCHAVPFTASSTLCPTEKTHIRFLT